jgi:hypothetical protein
MERNVLNLENLTDRLRGVDAPLAETDVLVFHHESWKSRDTLILTAALAGLVLAWLA